MPRSANYDHEVLTSTLLQFKHEVLKYFNKTSGRVWEDVSIAMQNRISAKAVYTHCRKCTRCHLVLNLEVGKSSDPIEIESEDEQDFFQYDGSFSLKYSEWSSFINTDNLQLVDNWTISFVEFLDVHVSKDCIWCTKRAKTINNGKYSFLGEFYCSDCECLLTVMCFNQIVKDCSLTFYFTRSDYDKNYVHTKKCNLRGNKRDKIGSMLATGQLGINLRRNMALDQMQFGDTESKNIPTLEVLRKAKQLYKEKKSKVDFEVDSCTTLLKLKYCMPYNTYLHNIGLDPFFIFYWTPQQMQIFDTFCKYEVWPTLQLDATGTVVKKIPRPNGNLSSHIFLYQGIISFTNKTSTCASQLPVFQMLSESHNIETISFWLDTWKKISKPKLKIVVVDHSLALLGAIAKSLAECSNLSQYLTECFLVLTKQSNRHPLIYIRADYAHVIKLIRSWDCFRKQSKLKEFYMRSMANLIKESEFEDFKKILGSLIIVSNSLYETTNNIENECGRSKKYLKNIIAGFEEFEVDGTQVGDEEQNHLIGDEFNSLNPNVVIDWINEFYEVSLRGSSASELEGFSNTENFFYLPDFSKSLKKFLKTFVIWGGVLRPFMECGSLTATSANVESYFNDLKNRSFIGENLPVNIDKFVVKHIDVIQGMMILAKNYIPNDIDNDKERDSDEPLENWKGLAVKRKKISYYGQLCPEMMYVTENQKVKIALLYNGNRLTRTYNYDKKQYMIKNTCPFDALAQIISAAYCDSKQFQQTVEFVNHSLVSFIKDLVKIGTTRNKIYHKRFEFLRIFFEVIELVDGTLQIDCATNACLLLEKIIGKCEVLASASEVTLCPKCQKEQKHVQFFLPLNINIISESIDRLQESILNALLKNIQCRGCKNKVSVHHTIHNQIFLELPDLIICLKNIPLIVNLNQKQYTFRAGIIFYKPLTTETIGHYVVVCRRNDACYELYDDLSDKVQNVGKETSYTFQILLYTV